MANVVGEWSGAEDRFGRNLRRLREERGMSQKDLAERLQGRGITLHPSAIAKIEARDAPTPRAIRLDEAEGIAICLGYPMSALLEGPDEAFRVAAQDIEAAVRNLASAERDLAAAFIALRGLRDLYDFQLWTEVTPELQDLRARIIRGLAEYQQRVEALCEGNRRSESGWRTADGQHHEAP